MDFTQMTVDEIRKLLTDLGMTDDEVKEIKGKTNLVAKYNELNQSNTNIQELNELVVEDSNLEVAQQILDRPLRTSPEWHDYVMSCFLPDETVPSLQDPNVRLPNVDGLRRVAELLIGEIVESYPRTMKSSTSDDRSATVEYKVSFVTSSGEKTFGGVANCATWNSEAKFSRFPESNAETRAEARALRKALGLKKVVAAEEISESEPDFQPEDPITDIQFTLIDKLCKQNNINGHKYINIGKGKYVNWREIPKSAAGTMIQWLNEYNRREKTIPDAIIGYEEGWKENS